MLIVVVNLNSCNNEFKPSSAAEETLNNFKYINLTLLDY